MPKKVRIDTKAKGNKVLAKQVKIKHRTLKERIADFTEEYVYVEWNTGKPKDKEIW